MLLFFSPAAITLTPLLGKEPLLYDNLKNYVNVEKLKIEFVIKC